MNFNSPAFMLFLPTVVVLFMLVKKHERARDLLLLVASYFFYMAWNWKYAGLIAFSTLVDYSVGRWLGVEERPRVRKLLLITSLITNLGLLAVFKYFNFFIDVSDDMLGPFGIDLSSHHLNLLLPVGISFYTFQTLSYTIDLYRREIPVEKSLLKFALFVAFFPQLVAGPIVRAVEFLPQLHRDTLVDRLRFNRGLALIFHGLFKKIVLADLLASLGVDAVFRDPTAFSSWDLLMGLYGYAFQIYCDFSGYSDIAIGAALLMGFELPVNFRRPYLSQNLREFWTRWHISLSSWLRDYLYIPLGGNKGTPARTRFNLMTTMLLGGLWHGAALNFVLWGAYHGVLLMLGRGGARSDERAGTLTVWRRRVVCFHLVLFSWLLFRVTGWDNFVQYLTGLLRFDGGTRLHAYFYFVLVLAAVSHFVPQDLLIRLRDRLALLPSPAQALLYASLLLLFTGLTLGAPAFIYFQF